MPTASTKEQIARAIERYPLIQQVFALASNCEALIYLVGGTVRDLLLDRDIHDLDFATPGDGLALARHIADRMDGAFVPLDRDRKTGRVVLFCPDKASFPSSRPDADCLRTLHLDFASLRGSCLTADLQGRDFTINAMAIELSSCSQWELHDVLGGVQDLAARVLRMASPSSLTEDPVRMLRAVRLQTQFGCTVEPATRQCIYETAPLLCQVSAERLRDEWFNILQQWGAADAVLELDRLRLLQTIAPPIAGQNHSLVEGLPPRDRLWDALASLRAIERLWSAFLNSSLDRHPLLPQALYALTPQIRSRYESTICDERTYLALLKCAALAQNAGPACASQSDCPSEDKAAQVAAELGRRWHCSNREVSLLHTAALHHRSARRLVTATTLPSADTAPPAQKHCQGSPALNRRAIYTYYRETGEYGVDAALIALANALAREPDPPTPSWMQQAEVIAQLLAPHLMERTAWISPAPLLSGSDLIEMLKLAPGPQIGELLEQLNEEQAAGSIHTREEAILWAQRLLETSRNQDQGRPDSEAER